MSNRITGVQLVLPAASLKNEDMAENAAIDTSKLAQRVLAAYPVDLASLRTWDAAATTLPATPATDDLGLVTGTFGTDALTVQTGDLKAAGATSRKARLALRVPANYDDGQTIQVRIRAGMLTTEADTSATVDLEAYLPDGDGVVGSDLCATDAISINSLTIADRDFTITASGVDPGSLLECVVTVAVNDGATGTAVTGVVTAVTLLADTRG